ncbi:aldo/keto reductase [Tritonibacter aquimaris]
MFDLHLLPAPCQFAAMTQMIAPISNAQQARFAFGTMQFGGRADARQSAEMFHAAWDAGIRHFDTAWVYTDGESERILGQLIRDRRADTVVASKVGFEGGAHPDNLQMQFDQSRARLELDQIDLLYLHRFDPNCDLRQTLEWFARQQQTGHIRHVGLSNFAAWQVVQAAWIAAEFGLKLSALQPMYSLVKRQAEVEILPMCAALDIVPLPYSPLGGGLLTGKYSSTDKTAGGRLRESASYGARYGQDWMYDSAARLTALAERHSVHPATLAVAWAAAHPSQPAPILSARSPEQLQPSLMGMNHALTPELYDEISALSPRPAPATDRLEEQ